MTDIEKIYSEYFYDVYLYIKSLSKDEHIAEDITSDTFIKAIKSIDSFNGTCDIRIWLCQIAKNNYFSYLRKNKKMVSVDYFKEQEDAINIEKSIISEETSMEIHKVLHKLEEPYKEVFYLRTFSELSFKQIGSLFQKNENWACVTYHRARKKLKNNWREQYENQM